MQWGILEVHVIGKNAVLVLFRLETDLNEFLLDDSAENVVIFVEVVDFTSGGDGEKVIILFDCDLHFHETFLDLGEIQLYLCGIRNN